MSSFYISKEIIGLGVVNPVACIIRNIEVKPQNNCEDEIEALMAQLESRYAQVSQSAEFLGFKDIFAKMGYEEQVPAGERLVNSFLKNGFKRINNIVDPYNIVSARYACGIGMHDADIAFADGKDMRIFRSSGEETIVPMFKDKLKRTSQGDMLYGADGSNIFAWLGKRDVDSDKHKVTDDTKKLLLVVTGNNKTSREFNLTIAEEIFDLIKKSCPQAEVEFLETVAE